MLLGDVSRSAVLGSSSQEHLRSETFQAPEEMSPFASPTAPVLWQRQFTRGRGFPADSLERGPHQLRKRSRPR